MKTFGGGRIEFCNVIGSEECKDVKEMTFFLKVSRQILEK